MPPLSLIKKQTLTLLVKPENVPAINKDKPSQVMQDNLTSMRVFEAQTIKHNLYRKK